MLSLQQKQFFSLFSLPNFFIQNFITILDVKWKVMNKGGAGQKFDVFSEQTFWVTPKSFCCN